MGKIFHLIEKGQNEAKERHKLVMDKITAIEAEILDMKYDGGNKRLDTKVSLIRQSLKTVEKILQVEKKCLPKASLVPVISAEDLIKFNESLREEENANVYVSFLVRNINFD